MFSTFDDARRFIDEHSIVMVDLKFCDLLGTWQHFTIPTSELNEELTGEVSDLTDDFMANSDKIEELEAEISTLQQQIEEMAEEHGSEDGHRRGPPVERAGEHDPATRR